MSTQIDVEVTTRPLTDDEVDHFFEHGWVVARSLISPELAARLLEVIKVHMGEDAMSWQERPGYDWTTGNKIYRSPSDDEPLFAEFVREHNLGESMSRLMVRPGPVRLLDDSMLVRPAVQSTPSTYHQDRPVGWDRDHVAPWIALDEITPAMGTMRFFSGSHKVGLVGKIGGSEEAVRENVPALRNADLAPQPHLMPGDATIHHHLTIHGSPENATDKVRWAYRLRYVPADSRYTDMPCDIVARLGFTPYQVYDHEHFPLTN